MKQIIKTDDAPQPIGPYSAGVTFGDFVFIAGQIGIDPKTIEVVSGGIGAETRQVLRNLQSVLEAAGSSLSDVVKTTVFLKNMGEFAQMNAIYAEFFKSDFPARSTVAVAGLPAGVSVEIEAIAVKRNS